jgi:hypothetical protein
MLILHDKYQTLFPPIERLNVDEFHGTHPYSGYRLHFSHQANVFLLGLYVYHNFPPLREHIEREMKETTVDIQREPPDLTFRYSGGSPYGEFLYRWRLSSLCHDIGTGIQLCQGNKTKIADTLGAFRFRKSVRSINELQVFNGQDLLSDLDHASGTVEFSDYSQYQEAHPFPDSIHHDHGIMGSLVFLQFMHGAYSRHRDNLTSKSDDGKEVFWHPEILSHSITQIAMAIAMHNLDKYPKALKDFSGVTKVFDMKRCPLSWLLKVADLLQEWDKPETGRENTDPKISTQIAIAFSDSKIFIQNFPEDKKDETIRIINSYISPSEVVSFG